MDGEDIKFAFAKVGDDGASFVAALCIPCAQSDVCEIKIGGHGRGRCGGRCGERGGACFGSGSWLMFGGDVRKRVSDVFCFVCV